MWRFMLPTARENGLSQMCSSTSDPIPRKPRAAAQSEDAQGMFDGDWHFALASYNRPGRLRGRSGSRVHRLLADHREHEIPAARDARIRPDDPGPIIIAKNRALGFPSTPLRLSPTDRHNPRRA